MTNISFLGRREDNNTVEQLKKKGTALTLNNQRNINEAIENLSKDSSEDNIKFLMNVAKGLRYGTSFELDDKKSNNEWKTKLQGATLNALKNTKSANKEALETQFKKVFVEKKEPSKEEKEILSLRDNLLKTKGLPQAMTSSKNDNVKNIAKHLDYFVISTEISTEEKKKCLESLNKLMSPDYKVNTQLKNKKPQVLGELLNDLVVKTAESDIPTIKQVDQRHHGMCAAISISRKAMAYEYKSLYVDQVLSELDNKKEMEVFDITKLGTGSKINVAKTEVDFDYADDKGYRILDASALQWMNIADTKGDGSVTTGNFRAFDKKFFDTFHDGHYRNDLADEKLRPHQEFLRALNKTDENIKSTRKNIEKRGKEAVEQKQSERFNAQIVVKANAALAKHLSEVLPEKSADDVNVTLNQILKLNKDKKSPFYIVDAEEDITKKAKIANFIKSVDANVTDEKLNTHLDKIFGMYELSTETSEYMNKEIQPKNPDSKMKKYYKPLFEVAANYRSAIDMKLDIPEVLKNEKTKYGLKNDATKNDVLKKYENEGKVVPESILRSLQDKYNKIAKFDAVVENAEVKGEKLDKPALFIMSDVEKSALDSVMKNINKMASEVSKELTAKEIELKEPLDKLIKSNAENTGSNWVQKEGHSGLNTPQEIRIFEQMTGVPHYAEEDIDVAADKIKTGKHSAVSSTSVYHNSRGGHAQYIADVAPLVVKDPQTGKISVKDAIMHDNTWGYGEHKSTWLNSQGLLRTDYQCGRGGEGGYITNKAWQNGTLIEDYKNKIGAIKNADGSEDKFNLFWDAIMPTKDTNAGGIASKVLQNLFLDSHINMSRFAYLAEKVKNVPAETLDKVMERAGNATETSEITKKTVYKALDNIKTEADYNKYNEKHPVKTYMKNLSKELSYTREKAEDDFINAVKISKVNLSNIDELRNPGFVVVKKYIDDKYNTASNKDFITHFKEMKNLPEDELSKIVKGLSDQHLGVKHVSEFEAAKRVQNVEKVAESILENSIFFDSIKSSIKLSGEGEEPEFEEMFFIVNRDWNLLSMNKEINALKAEMAAKHGVKASFPESNLFNKDEVAGSAKNFTDSLKQSVVVINALKDMQNGKMDKEDLTDEQIALALKNQLTDLNVGKKFFVDANIEPTHRKNVMGSLNKYLSSVQKGKNEDSSYKAFENDFIRYHVLDNPKEIMKEFVRLTKNDNTDNTELAKVYESYVVRGCEELASLSTKFGLRNAISNGHIHKMGNEILKLTTPKELEGGGVKIGSDEGYAQFINQALQVAGVDSTITLVNQSGLAPKTMKHLDKTMDFEILKGILNVETFASVINMIEEQGMLIEGLSLPKGSSSDKLRDSFINKINGFITYINNNQEKILATVAPTENSNEA